jgi:hypothetical protein
MKQCSEYLQKVKVITDVLNDPNKCIGAIAIQDAETVKDLLIVMITDAVNYFNIGKNMNDNQIIQTVELVLDSYPMFKLSDFKLCFNRAKSGRYGKVYDRIDGQIIFEWLGNYENEREQEIVTLRQNQSQESKQELKAPPSDKFLAKLKETLSSIEQQKKENAKRSDLRGGNIQSGDKYQEWIKQFDRLERKQQIHNSLSFVRRCGKIMSQSEYLEYKYKQELKVKKYLRDGKANI